MIHPNIPLQRKGGYHDTVSMSCSESADAAKLIYDRVVARLMSVNRWSSLSDKIKAGFQLIDPETGLPTERMNMGGYLRIDVPGIGNPSGNGYDWTRIIDIQNGLDERDCPFFALTVRPSPAPDAEDDKVAHFYTGESTNTFIVRRIGDCIYSQVHGRNEIENTSEVPLLDTVRNKAVAIGGKMGIADLNWLGFTKALLEPLAP